MRIAICRTILASTLFAAFSLGAWANEPETTDAEARSGLERIVVVAPRIVRERQTGPGHQEVTVVERRSYVDAYDLDLSRTGDFHELEARIRQAAEDLCRELARDHPFGQPSASECARRAYDDTVARVRERL